MERTYLCIDLKSFFASVECAERGLDPLTTNLVVADPERQKGTICLAITPAMKALGIKNRCRVFEIPRYVKYIMAPPRMRLYIDYAARVYSVYIKYISPEDIHVYSIDEAFLDVTSYLARYKLSPLQMAKFLLSEIFRETELYASCGIGTNLYLAKIALDITAKKSPDFIGSLNEEQYRQTLWDHTPITDFWHVGRGTAKRLKEHGIITMGELARANPDRIYKMFGKDAELLLDHARGVEPCTIADIKAYTAKSRSLSSGQVLMRNYAYNEALTIVKEMADDLCLDMTKKGVVCRSVTLYVGYSGKLEIAGDSGSARFESPTASSRVITAAAVSIFERVAQQGLPIRRFNISANDIEESLSPRQLSLFTDPLDERGIILQEEILKIKRKYGKNAIFKGMDMLSFATQLQRNGQIGGHKSGADRSGQNAGA